MRWCFFLGIAVFAASACCVATVSIADTINRPFATLVFRDDFSAPELGKAWSSWMSASTVRDGVLIGARIDGERRISVNSFSLPRTMDLEIKLSFRAEGGTFAVVIDDSSYAGSHAGHLAKVLVKPDLVVFEDMKTGSNKNEIQAMKGNFDEATKALLKSKEKTVLAAITENMWHQLRVRSAGDTLIVKIDNAELSRFSSEGFAHPTKDQIALWTMKNGIKFDNIVVRVP